MQYDPSLISLERETARLRSLEDKDFPKADIEAERDYLFRNRFGYTQEELVRPIPPTILKEIADATYDDIVDLAWDYNMDITCSEVNGGVPLPYAEDDEDEVIDTHMMLMARVTDYWTTPIVPPPKPTHGYVIRHWREWAAMMMAIDLNLYPVTDKHQERVKLMRESKDYSRRAERNRLKPHGEDEKMKVFGKAVSFAPGTISPPKRKGKPSAIREIVVQKIPSRRLPGTRPKSPRT